MAWGDTTPIADDSKAWVNFESITLLAKTSEAPPTSGPVIAGCCWFMIKKDMLPPSSPLLEMDATIEIPGRNLGGAVPKKDDLVRRSDGTYWRLMLVEIPGGVDYRCHVVRSTKR